MLLGIQFLTDVGSVNNYDYIQQIEFTAHDTQDLYFQIIDLSVETAAQGFNPPGRRYMPDATSTLMVDLISVECNKRVTRAAVQPFSQDGSIWKLPILGSDPLQGTIVLNMRLTEPTRTLNISNGKGNVLRIR